MEIVKRTISKSEYLSVYGLLHFDDKECFCGQPWILLSAHQGDNNSGWEKYSIGIAIHDQDDYDIGFVYYPGKEQFFNVLHELINWINDLEHGVICYDDFIEDVEGFFPDCGCEREWW